MASIVDDPGGRKRILFVGADEKRRAVRLGKTSMKHAEIYRHHIELIVQAQINVHAMPDETTHWLAGRGEKMLKRFERVGLFVRKSRSNVPLGTLLDEFFAAINVKRGTETTYRQTRTSLLDYFTTAKPVRDIEPLDADKWRQSMKAAGLAEATISKRVKTARQIFRKAIRWKMIDDNPLDGVKAGSQANKSRMYFLSLADTQKLLEACPDTQWRLIVALSRYGGLRCPSEHLGLRWGDVDWDKGRILVTSPKTEHQEGGESRYVPIFPELRPHLMEAFEKAEPGTEHVITRCRDAKVNLRTQFERIIKRAGLKPWPKLFHNLRSTRETELAETYPIHVVCAWLGNSEKVAKKHYLQVLDQHFQQASTEPDGKAAHFPAHHTATQGTTGAQSEDANHKKSPEKPGYGGVCHALQEVAMTPTGFEPVSRP